MTDIFEQARQIKNDDERNERAKTAVSIFRGMQPGLTGFARAMSKGRVEVVLAQGHPRTDGSKIYYKPPIELGDRLRHERELCDKRNPATLEQLCPSCKVREEVNISIYHEIGHIVGGTTNEITNREKLEALKHAASMIDSDDGRMLLQRLESADQELRMNFMGLGKFANPYLPMLINSLEDARVDALMFSTRRGLKPMFDAFVNKIFTGGHTKDDGEQLLWMEADANAQAMIGCFLIASGYEFSGWLHPDVEEILKDERLNELLVRVEKSRSVAGVFSLSIPILVRLRELGYLLTPDERQDKEADESDEQSSEEAGTGGDGGDNPDPDGRDSDSDDSEGDDGEEDLEETEEGPKSDGSSAGGDSEAEGDGEGGEEESDAGSRDDDDESASSSGSEQGDSDGDTGTADGGGAGGTDGEGSAEGSTDQDSIQSGDSSSEGEADQSLPGSPGEGEQVDGKESVDETESSGTSTSEGKDEDAGGGSDPEEGSSDDDDSSLQGSGEISGPSVPGSDNGGSGDSDGDEVLPPSDRDEAGDSADDGPVSGSEDSSNEEESDELIDPGADDGMGGTPVEFGDESDTQKAIDDFNYHEGDDLALPQDPKDEAAVDTAIVQGLYFEKPSTFVRDVRIHKYNQHFIEEGKDISLGWTRYEHNESAAKRAGQKAEIDIDEGIIGQTLQKARRIFGDNKRNRMERNKKSGKINTRILGTRAPTGDPRVFQKKIIPGRRDHAAILALDISGSTVGVNILLAKIAAYYQAEILHRTGVDFAIYAHTAQLIPGKTYRGGLALDVYVIKEFTDPWGPDQKAALSEIGATAENLDGHGIEFYRKILERHSATDKYLFYYSDGKMPAANYDEELEILQREIKYCKSRDIHLLGVGIRTDSPRRHGLDTVEIQSEEDLPAVMEHLERNLLRR